MNDQWDVIILGGGAAGLSAGMFAARRALRTLIITKEVGGQTATTLEIENYPGIDRIEGPVLMSQMRDQATRFGCQIVYADISGVQKLEDGFQVETSEGTHTARSLIIACGRRPRLLGLPEESKWLGRDIFYSSTDIPTGHTEGKIVTVIGGGSAALEEALLHSRVAKHVYVIHRRGSFRAEDILVQRATDVSNIEFVMHAEVSAIEGDDHVRAVQITQADEKKTIETDVVCVKIGYDSDAAIFGPLVGLDARGRIPIDYNAQTVVPGIFAAGDITHVEFEQIAISVGDGAKAGLGAYFYILEKQGKKGTRSDWGYLS